jgi:hypothetical protein
MVSAILLGVGVVALLSAYTAMSKTQRLAMETESMQRLALDKYDELVATEALQAQSLNGDFSDRGNDSYLWTAAVTPTSTANLSTLTVTVSRRDGSTDNQEVINGVVYIQPQTTTGTSTAPGATP